MDYEKKYLKYKLKYLSLLKNINLLETEGGVGVAKLNKKKNLEKCMKMCNDEYNTPKEEESVFSKIKKTISSSLSLNEENDQSKLIEKKEKEIVEEKKKIEKNEEFKKKIEKRDNSLKRLKNKQNKRYIRGNNTLKDSPNIPHGKVNSEYVYTKEKLAALIEHRKDLLKDVIKKRNNK